MKSLPKEITFKKARELSPLSEKALEDRFYGKNPEKWGVHRVVQKKVVKVVSRKDFIKYFLKPMNGFKGDPVVK